MKWHTHEKLLCINKLIKPFEGDFTGVLNTKVDHALPISPYVFWEGGRGTVIYQNTWKKKENFQDLELFLIGPNNSSIPIGGRLGLISHGIATLAVLKQPMFVVNILSLALVFPQNWSLFPRIDTHILI